MRRSCSLCVSHIHNRFSHNFDAHHNKKHADPHNFSLLHICCRICVRSFPFERVCSTTKTITFCQSLAQHPATFRIVYSKYTNKYIYIYNAAFVAFVRFPLFPWCPPNHTCVRVCAMQAKVHLRSAQKPKNERKRKRVEREKFCGYGLQTNRKRTERRQRRR